MDELSFNCTVFSKSQAGGGAEKVNRELRKGTANKKREET